MKIKTIAIVGLGLMGGSLSMRCRKVFPKAKILGVTRNAGALQIAKKKKWIHQGFTKIDASIKDADLTILSTPVSTFKASLKKLDSVLKPNAVVTDVGSTKATIYKQLPKKGFKNIRFIGAHPMVGSHERGIRACSSGLYESGYTFVMKHRGNPTQAHRLVSSFWGKVSKKVISVTPDEHDRIVSEISHLPHAAAVCLILSVQSKSLAFSAKGFKDTTRIAAGDESIWLPIFQSNRKSVLLALKSFEASLKAFRRELQREDDKNLSKMLKKASKSAVKFHFDSGGFML